jgi:hypothetical protein
MGYRNTQPEEKKHEADTELKAIALRVFGSSDGVRPKFPRTGELIQEAMEQAYNLGKKKGTKNV